MLGHIFIVALSCGFNCLFLKTYWISYPCSVCEHSVFLKVFCLVVFMSLITCLLFLLTLSVMAFFSYRLSFLFWVHMCGDFKCKILWGLCQRNPSLEMIVFSLFSVWNGYQGRITSNELLFWGCFGSHR